MKKQSIITRLICCFLIAIIVPISLLGYFMVNKTSNMLIKNMKLTSTQTLQESQKAFSQYLQGLSQQVNILSRKNEIKHLYDEDKKGAYDQNVELIKDALVAAVKTTNGSKQAYFATAKGDVFTCWVELEKDKKVPKDITETGVDSTKKTWYANAIGSKERNGVFAVFTEPYMDEKTQTKIITVSQEIKLSGEVIGVVAIDIDFNAIESFVQNIGLLNTGYVLLANDQGDILVNNEKNKLTTENLIQLDILKEPQTAETASKEESETNHEILAYDKTLGRNDLHILVFDDIVTDWKLIGFINPNQETQENKQSILMSILSISIIGIIIGLIVSILVTLSIKKYLTKINTIVKEVATGDFTKQIKLDGKNEFTQLADSLNTMITNTSRLMKNVDTSAASLLAISENISTISEETQTTANTVSTSIQEIALGSTNQAHNTQEVSSEVENLAQQLEEANNYVQEIHEMSETTHSLSSSGLEQIKTLTSQAEKTKKNSALSTEIVSDMTKSMEKINFISGAIASITEQTNLLSLNASIEAARAGEAGKGFAVVADEIRKLSDESKQSTDEIKQIVVEINNKALEAEKAMRESQSYIAEQELSILQTQEVFNKILDSIEHLVKGIQYINTLNTKMATSKTVVVERIEGIAAISEEAASTTEEVTAASEEVNATMHELTTYTVQLKDMANQLKDELSKFTL